MIGDITKPACLDDPASRHESSPSPELVH